MKVNEQKIFSKEWIKEFKTSRIERHFLYYDRY